MGFKVVVAGDGAMGKSCLLITYDTGKFPIEYIPSTVDTFTKELTVDNKSIELGLWDVPSYEDFERARFLVYPMTNVFVICYAVNCESAFANVKQKWYPEIHHVCPDASIILLATKSDLRDNKEWIARLKYEDKIMITPEQGKKLAKEIGAAEYLECSALTGKGVNTVFDVALTICMNRNPNGNVNGNYYHNKCVLQ